MNSYSWIFVALAIAWFVQLYFANKQMRRFYGRVSELRRKYNGVTSIGMEGSTWRRRQYAVIVMDKEKRILAVEQLSGWTVLAKLEPVPGLEGLTIAQLFDDTVTLPVEKKLLLAMRNAAQHILTAEAEKEEELGKQEKKIEEHAAISPSATL
jgi:DNA-binding transcriptional regulator of glucitol operon